MTVGGCRESRRAGIEPEPLWEPPSGQSPGGKVIPTVEAETLSGLTKAHSARRWRHSRLAASRGSEGFWLRSR